MHYSPLRETNPNVPINKAERLGRVEHTPNAASRRPSSAHTPPSGARGAPHRLIGTPIRSFIGPSFLTRELRADDRIELTVVLDLDETLVSNRHADHPQAILRPFAAHVLHALRQLPKVEIILWTASTAETGEPVVAQLEAKGFHFDDVIYRNDRWFTEPVYTKDLRLLGRPLGRCVVIDNTPNCCKLNRRNAILIEDFHGDCAPRDEALINMYYAVQALLHGCEQGFTVVETLHALVREQQLCHTVHYELPEHWSTMNQRDVPPLIVPAHGTFVRLHTTTVAPVQHWTR